MTESLNIDILEQALRQVGENLPTGFEVKIIIVGGAAGMLTGILPVGRTTFDCDVILCEPTDRLAELENIASGVAEKLGLPPRWLNADVQLLFDALPRGWESRRVMVGYFSSRTGGDGLERRSSSASPSGSLMVWAVSRPDLIAMKFLAGRVQDIEDLQALAVSRDEFQFVRRYLDDQAALRHRSDDVSQAKLLLRELSRGTAADETNDIIEGGGH